MLIEVETRGVEVEAGMAIRECLLSEIEELSAGAKLSQFLLFL